MRGFGRWWLLLSGVCGLFGCAGPEARLLELEGANPGQLEGPGRLWLSGRGFDPGAACEVRFEGRSFGAAREPQPVGAVVRGRAVSGERVEVPLGWGELAALGGAGSFEGRVHVAFPTRSGDGRLVGELAQLRLDLVLDTAERFAEQRALEPEARTWLDRLGIALGDDASQQGGLVVAVAREAGAASAAGLLVGDRMVRLGGLGLHALADFVPAPGVRTLSLWVERSGHYEPLELAVSLAGTGAPVLDASRLRFAALAVLVLLTGLLLSPWPWLTEWLLRLETRRARGAPEVDVGLWGMSRAVLRAAAAGPGLGVRRRARALLLPLMITGLWVLLVFFQALSGVTFNSLPVYLALGAASITLTLVDATRGTRAERVAAVREQLPRMLGMAVVILCACALSGTRSLEGIVADQGGAPWSWGMFRKPALLLAFPLFVVHAARASWAAWSPDGTPAPLRTGLEVAGRVFMCGVGTAIFLGGWQTEGLPHPAWLDARLLGAVLFVAKAWGLAYVFWQARSLMVGERDRGLRTALGAGLALLFSGLWLWLDPTPSTEAATGYVLFLVCVTAPPLAWALRASERSEPRSGVGPPTAPPAGRGGRVPSPG
jgi:hypothetical protein